MVLIEEVTEPEIKPVKVEEKKQPVEKKVENVQKIAAQPKSRPKRRAKFVIELDNRDPDEGKIVEKTEVERKLDDELDDEERAKNYPRMTKEALKKICKQHKLYNTPYLNDQLYLHFKGWWRIENLEEYTGLRCLWLESNGLRKLENLEAQTNMRCLYIQQNLIEKIENLQHCKMLAVLNLESNRIKKLENLDCLEHLETLHIGKNCLSTYDSLVHLINLKKLSVLSLQNNRIEDPKVAEIFYQMETLRVLNLMGNPICGKLRYYRRTLTINIKTLNYLDDRPVFPRDRALAEAWARGGPEEEAKERTEWANKDRKKIESSIHYLRSLKEKAEEKRRAARREAGEKSDSSSSEDETEDNKASDTEEIPLNQMTFKKDEESDEEIPDLEVVPKDDLVDMTRLSQSAPAVPKGFRRVEIEMAESEDDEDPFDQEEINMDDLPDLEMSQGDTLLVTGQDSSKSSEEPMVLETKSEGKSLFEIIPDKPKSEMEELLFTKVSDQSEDSKPADQPPKKILIEEIENDDII